MHLFFQPDPGRFELDEEEARHSTKVLRLTSGELIYVTDGKGMLAKCILNVQGRRVGYEIVEKVVHPRRPYRVNMGIAPTRKAERNEWMVEKMVEIGVDRIDFLVTAHTHQETMNRVVNLTRLTRIAVAAMKQSQQFYMPEITVNNQLDTFIQSRTEPVRLIAYVLGHDTVPHVFNKVIRHTDTSLLIGPEGDFTPEEVSLALTHGFKTISLGPTRLRTETAAIAACHAVNLAQVLSE